MRSREWADLLWSAELSSAWTPPAPFSVIGGGKSRGDKGGSRLSRLKHRTCLSLPFLSFFAKRPHQLSALPSRLFFCLRCSSTTSTSTSFQPRFPLNKSSLFLDRSTKLNPHPPPLFAIHISPRDYTEPTPLSPSSAWLLHSPLWRSSNSSLSSPCSPPPSLQRTMASAASTSGNRMSLLLHFSRSEIWVSLLRW